MSTAVPTSGWSAEITLIAGARYTYTATPGVGGSMRVQYYDGTGWYDFTNSNISTTVTSLVPAVATKLRAQAFTVAGTLQETRDSFAGATPARSVPIFTDDLVSPTAEMLADVQAFYVLQSTNALYRSNGASLELVGGGSGNGYFGVLTMAAILAIPSPQVGWTARASDVGNMQPLYYYNGTSWKPAGGRQLAFLLSADTTPITPLVDTYAAETACLFPIGSLNYTGATLQGLVSLDKAGQTNTLTASWRFGSGAAVTDALISSFAGTSRTFSGDTEMRFESTTSLRVLGMGSETSALSRLAGSQNNARPVADTVPDVSTTANTLGISLLVSTTGEAVNFNRYQVYVMG